MIDITVESFDLAEKYRSIVTILIDGSMGQMMEPAELPAMQLPKTVTPDWAVGGLNRGKRLLNSLYINPPDQEIVDMRLLKRWKLIEANEVRYKEYYVDDADFVVIGFGTAGRIALSAVRMARAEGIKVGLMRPVTLAPFPGERIKTLSKEKQGFLVVEMNTGQMLEDILKFSQGRIPVEFYGRPGGIMLVSDEISWKRSGEWQKAR